MMQLEQHRRVVRFERRVVTRQNQLRRKIANTEPTIQRVLLLSASITSNAATSGKPEMKKRFRIGTLLYIGCSARRCCVDISNNVEIPTLLRREIPGVHILE